LIEYLFNVPLSSYSPTAKKAVATDLASRCRAQLQQFPIKQQKAPA
jgi:hypothetical protein